jgi:hypothetical protein
MKNIEPVKTTRAHIKRVLLPLGDSAYFTVGTADEKHGLFGLDYRRRKLGTPEILGGARYLDRCQKGCCPGEGVRSPTYISVCVFR